jgi:cobalt-zinc-cadmium efflux system outer membrane protein
MRVAFRALALASVVSWCPHPVVAQPVQTTQTTPMTLVDVLARARQQAPQIVSARLAVEEARARVTGAALRLSSNPEVDLSVGDRRGDARRSTDLEVGALQMFEPPGRRSARVAGAGAQLEQRTAAVDETTREVLRDAAIAFYRALYASERIALLMASETLARDVLHIADRRVRAGDLAVLDVNLARASLARARADREAAEAERVAALGALRTLLGSEGALSVQGSLALGDAPDRAALTRSLAQRPEFRAFDAAIREAEADAAVARTMTKPGYGVGARYRREGGDHIVLGGVTLTLPMFAKGQEQRDAASARVARLRVELEAARVHARIELDTALATHQHRVAAARVLEAEALPGLDENAALATRSFEVGQIGLADVLLIRRELADTRSLYLFTLLEAALARVEIDATAAVLR